MTICHVPSAANGAGHDGIPAIAERGSQGGDCGLPLAAVHLGSPPPPARHFPACRHEFRQQDQLYALILVQKGKEHRIPHSLLIHIAFFQSSDAIRELEDREL